MEAATAGIQANEKSKGILLFLAGLFFAILWPSASTATKIGLQAAQPFVISEARFMMAGTIMLVIAHGILRKRFPSRKEWKQLAIYGLLNITIYLGLYVLAMQQVSAGLGSLAVATNPVFINLITAILYKKKPAILSLLLCTGGVLLAAWPLLQNSFATPRGLLLLLLSMLVYSGAVIYFSRRNWSDLHIMTINGWQTLLGGLFLLPVALVTYHPDKNQFNQEFFGAVGWLAISVSIGAVQLWLYLLRDNAVKASFWLFLCPVSGFIIANIMMQESIGWYTVSGMLLVIAGLYLVLRRKK